MIFVTDERVEVNDFLKTYFRMCTNTKNLVPARPWFDDPDEEEQWGCGYRDDLIAHFKQDSHNKNSSLQDQGKYYENHTLENRIKFWLIIIGNAQGSGPDYFHDYDYNDEGMDNSVSDAGIFPEIGDPKKLFDILRSK